MQIFKPLITAIDTFLREPLLNTKRAPHVRDSVDVKRWMILVVMALMPCTIWAIWNNGLQAYVWSSNNGALLQEYLEASTSFSGYFSFCFSEGRWWVFILKGLRIFLPVLIISYGVGGLIEAIFAGIRGKEMSEGFLVSGLLFALILPPTIPYWMVALGVGFGLLLSKEIFGGTGMNIVNPALLCRALLFFSFPSKFTSNFVIFYPAQ